MIRELLKALEQAPWYVHAALWLIAGTALILTILGS